MLASNKKSNGGESRPPISMEQVWSEINLQEINHSPTPSAGAAPPPTGLTLNSIFFPADDARLHSPFAALSSSSLANKRQPENGTGDRHYKRMMKNRESASRSRARKQAYVSELQMKISHLVEENHKLKDQLKKLVKMQEEAAQEHPKKHLLPRTKTAPF